MSQHALTIANESGALFRADVNNALAALATKSSGNTAPSTTYPYMYWVDTSGSYPVLKMRNAANNAWLTIGRADSDNFGIAGSVTSSSAPSSPQASQFWVDTSGANPILKIRSYDNSSWITVGRTDVANFGLMPLTGGTFSAAIDFSNTDYMKVPGGTTAQRPGSPAARMIRWNSDLLTYEGYNGSAWQPIGGGGWSVTAVQSISASGTISSSTTDQRQLRYVQGNAASVSASTTPFGTGGGWKDGTEIQLVGYDDTNSVILTFNDAAKGLVGNFSTIELTKFKSVTFQYSSTLDRWILQGA